MYVHVRMSVCICVHVCTYTNTRAQKVQKEPHGVCTAGSVKARFFNSHPQKHMQRNMSLPLKLCKALALHVTLTVMFDPPTQLRSHKLNSSPRGPYGSPLSPHSSSRGPGRDPKRSWGTNGHVGLRPRVSTTQPVDSQSVATHGGRQSAIRSRCSPAVVGVVEPSYSTLFLMIV